MEKEIPKTSENVVIGQDRPLNTLHHFAVIISNIDL